MRFHLASGACLNSVTALHSCSREIADYGDTERNNGQRIYRLVVRNANEWAAAIESVAGFWTESYRIHIEVIRRITVRKFGRVSVFSSDDLASIISKHHVEIRVQIKCQWN